MDWIAFTFGLLTGVCVGCGLMAVVASGAAQDREDVAWRNGEASGYRKAITDFGQLGP